MPRIARSASRARARPAYASALSGCALCEILPSAGLLTLRKDVREVAITFIVNDEDGRPVGHLRPDQIGIYADGSPVRSMHAFYREHDLPLNLACLSIPATRSLRTSSPS